MLLSKASLYSSISHSEHLVASSVAHPERLRAPWLISFTDFCKGGDWDCNPRRGLQGDLLLWYLPGRTATDSGLAHIFLGGKKPVLMLPILLP